MCTQEDQRNKIPDVPSNKRKMALGGKPRKRVRMGPESRRGRAGGIVNPHPRVALPRSHGRSNYKPFDPDQTDVELC